jgi:hypothetical protein
MDRRRFLKWAGGSLALPLLQLPGRGFSAQAAPSFPTRFLVFYQPNGTKKELWSPREGATENAFELGMLLEPLSAHKDKLVVMDGINMLTAGLGPGGPHQRGMATLLTGQQISTGDFVGGDGRRAGWGVGPSIDQHMIKTLRPPTALNSLELGVRVEEAIPRSRIIYFSTMDEGRVDSGPIAPVNDPTTAFDRVFGSSTEPQMSEGEMRQLLRRRQSVLDFVYKDFAKIQRQLGAADRLKLESHAESLRDLERRLSVIIHRTDNCLPGRPSAMNVRGESEYRDVLRAQIDVMVNAMACDITRFGSIQCSSSVNALRFLFMDLNDNQGHSLSHSGDSNSNLQDQWEQMLLWYSEQQAYLLDRLASIPEGDGTLLDNTLIFFVNELSRGNTHSHTDMPFMLGGGAGGRLRGGRYLKYDNANHLGLLSGILQLMGIPQERFGHPDYAEGPLTGLVS